MLLGLSLLKFFLSFSFPVFGESLFCSLSFVTYCSNFVCPDPVSSVYVQPTPDFLFYEKRFPLLWIVENALSFGWKSLVGCLYLEEKINLSQHLQRDQFKASTKVIHSFFLLSSCFFLLKESAIQLTKNLKVFPSLIYTYYLTITFIQHQTIFTQFLTYPVLVFSNWLMMKQEAISSDGIPPSLFVYSLSPQKATFLLLLQHTWCE